MYAELCCRSYYSFLEGASSPDALAHQAASVGLPALALTDRNGLYGAFSFYRACREVGVHPIIGAQLTVEGGDEIIVLCTSLAGYTKLSLLLTEAHRGRSKGDPLVFYSQLARLSGGDILCLVGGKIGRLPALLRANKRSQAAQLLQQYRTLFGEENTYVMLTHHHDAGDRALCLALAALAAEQHLSLVATNAPCYATKQQGRLHDVLLCIKQRVTLSQSHHSRSGNHQRYLKSPTTMHKLFHLFPEAVENTLKVAQRCQLTLDFSSYRVPDFPLPPNHTVDSYLAHLAMNNLAMRYPIITDAIRCKVEDELALIAKLKLSGYFLVVWDIVQFARSKDIPVQGRGSAANSIVSYVLGITPVDPVANNLFLGRFIHEGMTEAPDIDLDFASARQEDQCDREDVIQYVYKKYGQDHVAMVCTFITFQARSAIREVGKVLEISDPIIDRLARLTSSYGTKDLFQELQKSSDVAAQLPPETWKLFQDLVVAISDLPRHLGIHVGGMIIASRPIAELVPLEPARMEGRIVCQWDKDMVGDAGLIKVDILGLGMLAVLREARHLIRAGYNQEIDLERIPLDDPAIYHDMAIADTVGVFQIESRAQMQSLPRVKPKNFAELGVQIALIRPGPLQGNMVSPYIRRKQGDEAITYLHPSLKPVLEDTLGVILFQEQVLMAAVAIAGFTDAQAADLRRAMSRKRSQEAMQRLRGSFLEGANRNRIPTRAAEQVFGALEGFALYGFCKSHALSFACISYASAWLKHYHPAAFLAALLNNQPMGFYPCQTLIDDATRHGVVSHPVSINDSVWRCHLLSPAEVQLGFLLVKGADGTVAQHIVTERAKNGPYASLRNFVQRTKLQRKAVEHLIQAGACDCFGLDRREMLWQLWLLQRNGLFLDDLFQDQEIHAPPLPASQAWDLLRGEYNAQGFSAQRHPIALLRTRLDARGVISSKSLQEPQDSSQVKLGGLVVCRQRPPTAKGFAFLTLEDEFGLMNIIIPPNLYDQVRPIFRLTPLVYVEGIKDQREGIINVRATALSAL